MPEGTADFMPMLPVFEDTITQVPMGLRLVRR
jgi:hypothetical protein